MQEFLCFQRIQAPRITKELYPFSRGSFSTCGRERRSQRGELPCATASTARRREEEQEGQARLEDEDEDYREQADEEMKMHQSYRIKALLCRKGYTYCLICHLASGEKELPKDQNKVICPTKRISTSMQNQPFKIISSCAFLLLF